MAVNEVFKDAEQLTLTVGASRAARSSFVYGAAKLPCYLLTATGSSGTTAATCLLKGVVSIAVKGHDGTSNAAIAAGDKIYWTDADNPKLSVRTAGTFWGVALEPVTSGATTSIRVLMAGLT